MMQISFSTCKIAYQVTHQKSITNNCLSVNIQNSTNKTIQHLLQQRLFENQSPFEVLKPYEIDLLMVYPELFTRMDRQRILRVLERDGERVSEGDEPLEYWVYRESESRPTISEKSQLTLDIWTSKDEQTPLLVLGDGIIEETGSSAL